MSHAVEGPQEVEVEVDIEEAAQDEGVEGEPGPPSMDIDRCEDTSLVTCGLRAAEAQEAQKVPTLCTNFSTSDLGGLRSQIADALAKNAENGRLSAALAASLSAAKLPAQSHKATSSRMNSPTLR